MVSSVGVGRLADGQTPRIFCNDEGSRRLASPVGVGRLMERQTLRFSGTGEGSRRWNSPVGIWRLEEGQTPRCLALLKGVSVGMCTVPILRLLLQHEEVKGDNDVRGSSPQKSSGKQQLFNTIYSVVCIYSWMYFCLHELQNISRMFVFEGSVSRQHFV